MKSFVIDNDKALEKIKILTGRYSSAEVVRDALALYEELLKRRMQGQKIYLGKNSEDLTRFDVTTFENSTRI